MSNDTPKVIDAPAKPVAVLAGSYVQFRNYARDHPEPKPIFCDESYRFLGLEFSKMVVVGTFREKKNAFAIYARVLPMLRPVTKKDIKEARAAITKAEGVLND
jgi:hypothetical protein